MSNFNAETRSSILGTLASELKDTVQHINNFNIDVLEDDEKAFLEKVYDQLDIYARTAKRLSKKAIEG